MICKHRIAHQLLRVDARPEVPLTPEQTAAVKDQSIDFSDLPELDEEFWDRSEVVKPDRTDQITMRVERSVLACFQAPGKGYQARMNRVLHSTVRHIAKQSTDASGRSMRSEANFRLRECRPRPHLGSSPAGFSAFFHQSRASERLMGANGSFVAGITGASPIFSCLPRRRIVRGIGSMSDHRN